MVILSNGEILHRIISVANGGYCFNDDGSIGKRCSLDFNVNVMPVSRLNTVNVGRSTVVDDELKKEKSRIVI
jgi:hypothetical protein